MPVKLATESARSGDATGWVITVDFSERVVYKEEYHPELACSLCHEKGSYVVVWPETEARVFGSEHSLCEECLHHCFDVVIAV